MPKTIKVPTLLKGLKERREKLQKSLTRLANTQFALVRVEPGATDEDLPRLVITSSVRVRRTNFHFRVWEDFRESDGSPFLYGFTYTLQPQDPAQEPLFRYECHPDIDDPSLDEDGVEVEETWEKRNPYGTNPHFHPYKVLSHPINKLHYPFQRSERSSVVFSLIAWIEADLVKRFYDSGRVKAAN